VAIGDNDLATHLFELATDPALLFHQIFNIFRSWCAGLWVSRRYEELRELLYPHRFAEGLRGAYVQAFAGLLANDSRRVEQGVRDICRYEQSIWQTSGWQRGVGLINFGAVAVLRLAHAGRLQVKASGASLPAPLIRPR